MNDFAPLSPALRTQLQKVMPSHDRDMAYYPCLVTLHDGTLRDRVYIVQYEQYIRAWGVTPAQDPAKRSIPVEAIASIAESPSRLPAALANRLYAAGESGMGHCLFTVVFRDGRRQSCVTGNAVDFPSFPPGYSTADVIGVEPHTRTGAHASPGPEYAWCIYG